MFRIAVTGGIACGKSKVADYLRQSGIAVCDADDVVHDLFEHDRETIRAIIAEFGNGVLAEQGGIDRSRLARIVFGDFTRLKVLNDIVHPVVKVAINNWLTEQESIGHRMAVVIVPLLFEAGMQRGWDAIICVACREETQLERLRQRGLSLLEARRRLMAQMPTSRKAELADIVVHNDGSPDELFEKIDSILEDIQEK